MATWATDADPPSIRQVDIQIALLVMHMPDHALEATNLAMSAMESEPDGRSLAQWWDARYQADKGDLPIGLGFGKYRTQLCFHRRQFDALRFGVFLQGFSVTQGSRQACLGGGQPK